MTVQSISATLVNNLRATGNPEAIGLADKFENHRIGEKEFIAAAGHFARVTSSDTAGALARSAARHQKGVILSDNVYAKVFGISDRGEKVMAVQKFLEAGEINATEVLNA